MFILLEVPAALRRSQHEGKCRRSKNFVKNFVKEGVLWGAIASALISGTPTAEFCEGRGRGLKEGISAQRRHSAGTAPNSKLAFP